MPSYPVLDADHRQERQNPPKPRRRRSPRGWPRAPGWRTTFVAQPWGSSWAFAPTARRPSPGPGGGPDMNQDPRHQRQPRDLGPAEVSGKTGSAPITSIWRIASGKGLGDIGESAGPGSHHPQKRGRRGAQPEERQAQGPRRPGSPSGRAGVSTAKIKRPAGGAPRPCPPGTPAVGEPLSCAYDGSRRTAAMIIHPFDPEVQAQPISRATRVGLMARQQGTGVETRDQSLRSEVNGVGNDHGRAPRGHHPRRPEPAQRPCRSPGRNGPARSSARGPRLALGFRVPACADLAGKDPFAHRNDDPVEGQDGEETAQRP